MEGNSPFLRGRKKKKKVLGKEQQADIGGSTLTQCDLGRVTSPLGTTVSSSIVAGRVGCDKQVQH